MKLSPNLIAGLMWVSSDTWRYEFSKSDTRKADLAIEVFLHRYNSDFNWFHALAA